MGVMLGAAGDGKGPVELEIKGLVAEFHGQPIVARETQPPDRVEDHYM
jgi:hypothetical protein